MSILIKGMAMPKNCLECPLEDSYSGYACHIIGKKANWGIDGRLSDCPLIEIPPHGRLIDADALYKSYGASGNCNKCDLDAYKCQYHNEHTMMEFCALIDDAPTIIESEDDE